MCCWWINLLTRGNNRWYKKNTFCESLKRQGFNVKNYKLLLKLSVFTSILMLAGCGQKGPLYLEKAPQKAPVQQESETSASDAAQ